jgi:hypothetical protein
MMEPKVPGIEAALEDLAQQAYGNSRTKSFASHTCVKCGKLADRFSDTLSAKEYTLSGLCQECQDEFFEEEEV